MTGAMGKNKLTLITAAVGVAIFMNLVVFGWAPLLVKDKTQSAPLLEPIHLMPFMPAEEPPPPPEDQEPPPPEPAPRLKVELKTLTALPQTQVDLALPQLDLEIDPRIKGGPAVAAPAGLKSRFSLGEVDTPPLLTGRIPPAYPYMARRRGIEGWVKVIFLVDARGRVDEIQVLEAQPAGVFEESVRRCLPSWRFNPGVKDGRTVETWVETTIRFQLEKG